VIIAVFKVLKQVLSFVNLSGRNFQARKKGTGKKQPMARAMGTRT